METTTDATRATAEAMPAPSILSLYRQWEANHRHHNRKGAGYTDKEMAALCAEDDIVMDQMCGMDSRSPLDVVAKLLVTSGRLEYSVNDGWVDSIRDEALAMLDADAELISLGAQFQALWSEEVALSGSDAWDHAHTATASVVAAIEPMAARTLYGLRVKALVVQWCWGADTVNLAEDQNTVDLRFANSIVADLIGEARS